MGKKKRIKELEEQYAGLMNLRLDHERRIDALEHNEGIILSSQAQLASSIAKLEVTGFSSDPGCRITDLQQILLLMPGFKEVVEAYSQRPPVTPSVAWVRSATEVQAMREEAAKAHQDGKEDPDGQA